MKLNTRKLMIQYCILQGSYWASFCVIYAFATVFLLSRGFESSMIGVIIAAGNILGVVLQPMVASIADRSEKISLHKLTAMLSVLREELVPSPMRRLLIFLESWSKNLEPEVF